MTKDKNLRFPARVVIEDDALLGVEMYGMVPLAGSEGLRPRDHS